MGRGGIEGRGVKGREREGRGRMVIKGGEKRRDTETETENIHAFTETTQVK